MSRGKKVQFIVSINQVIDVEIDDKSTPTDIERRVRVAASSNLMKAMRSATIGEMMDVRFVEEKNA